MTGVGGGGVTNTVSENILYSMNMGKKSMFNQFKVAVSKPDSPEFDAAYKEYKELQNIGANRNIARDGFAGSFYNAWQMAAPAATSWLTGFIGKKVGGVLGAGVVAPTVGVAGFLTPMPGDEVAGPMAATMAGEATGGLVGFYAPWVLMGIGDMRLRARDEGYSDIEGQKMANIFGPLHGIAEGMQQQVVVGAWKKMFKEAPEMAFERFGPTMLKYLLSTAGSYGVELSEEFTQGTLVKGFDLALKMRNRPHDVDNMSTEARRIASAGWDDMMKSMGPLAWMMAVPVLQGGYQTANRAIQAEGARANIVNGLRKTDVFRGLYGLSNKEANNVVDEMGKKIALNRNSLGGFPLAERIAFMQRVKNDAIVNQRSLTMNKLMELIPGSKVDPIKGGGYVVTTKNGDKVRVNLNADLQIDPKTAELLFPGTPIADLKFKGLHTDEAGTAILEDGTEVQTIANVDLSEKADRFSYIHEWAHVLDSHFSTYKDQKEREAIVERARTENPEQAARLDKAMGRVAADRELFAMQMEVALSQADAGVTGDSYVQKLWNQAAQFQQELHETLINEDIADVLLNGGVRNRQEAKRVPGEIESTTVKAMEESLPGQVYERGGEMQLTPEEEYDEWLAYTHSEEYAIWQDDQDALAENVSRIGEMRDRRERAREQAEEVAKINDPYEDFTPADRVSKRAKSEGVGSYKITEKELEERRALEADRDPNIRSMALVDRKTGRKAIIHASTSQPGKWQLSFLTPEGKPESHQTYLTREMAHARAMNSGYSEVRSEMQLELSQC
jgi:hypothetical protein